MDSHQCAGCISLSVVGFVLCRPLTKGLNGISLRHPFTISSAPSDPYISIHIRVAGDFTRALGERLGCTSALATHLSQEAKRGTEKTATEGLACGAGSFYDVTKAVEFLPTLRVDGPFGTAAEDVFKSEIAVLVGTGIGVTPWASVLKNIG